MKKKIAQIGTFDVENFGDLLFPVIMEYYMRDYEIDLFSPRGNCIKPFEKEKFVYSLDALEAKCQENSYEAIVVGGGELVRCDTVLASHYNSTEENIALKMWALPILVGSRYDIPVIFNAPGVPFRFNRSMHGMIKELFKNVDRVSVRDEVSAKYLAECGVQNINIVPDTVLSIKEVYTEEKLRQCRENLRKKISLPEDNSYIVIQHNCCNMEDGSYLDYFGKTLQSITEEKLNIVFMPIGYIHQDSLFLERIYVEEEPNQYMINVKLTPIEMCAVLQGSAGYIGSSMHGAVVSYAYEKFAICINTSEYSKISGLLKLIGHSEWEVQNISELPEKFNEIKGTKVSYAVDLKKQIVEHFDTMKAIIEKGAGHKYMPDMLREYYKIASLLNDAPTTDFTEAMVYFDYGSGFSDEGSKEISYKDDNDKIFCEVEIPAGVLKIRIDPIEGKMLLVKSLQVFADGNEIVPTIENVMSLGDNRLIVNTDPSIIFDNNGYSKVCCYINAQILKINDFQDLIGQINFQKNVEIQDIMETLDQIKREAEAILLEKNSEIERAAEKDEEKQKIIDELKKALTDKEAELKEIKENAEKLKRELELSKKEIPSNQNNNVNAKIDELNAQVDSLNTLNLQLRNQIDWRENQIEEFRRSFSWKLTAPVRYLGGGFLNIMQKTYVSQCALEALKILFTKGPGEVIRACGRFVDRTYHSKEADLIAPGKSKNNKDGYCAYDAEYQENRVFEGMPDVKMLAFYLPQYHTFPENDEWWGKGFTEWVNVKNGESRFEGHYQPRVPHRDIGYYSLEDVTVLKKQAKLAKEHGIYGFCFYYYWFSGKRLMEKPVDMLLEHPEIDLPFCLCWANENWTRAWDGKAKNVLIAQEYSDEDDNRFMTDLKKYVDDSRYIRINGKPLIIVYNPGQIPNCHKSFKKWRECAKEIGLGDILIWTCQTANNTAELLNISDCIDAEVEFPPHNMWLESIAVRDLDLKGKSAFIYNYQCLVEYMVKKLKEDKKNAVPVHHGCMLAWDNAARRKDSWFTYYAFSLHSLYKWVLAIAQRARKDFAEEERFIFVNAWNEWGEGTYLEPDEKYGYANINTVSKALYEIPFEDKMSVLDEQSLQEEELPSTHKIAVQIHMFYPETIEETIQNINQIPYEFDCYVSTDSEEKKNVIEKAFREKCRCVKLQVDVFKNRGRDVAPFIVQMAPILQQYSYVCHIHSKKTKTGEYGNEWRKYIFKHLFGCKEYVKAVFSIFQKNSDIGIIMPETYPVLELQAEWGGNLEGVKTLLERIGCAKEQLPQNPVFPVGNMFWAKTDAIMPAFTSGLTQQDFPEEQGQTNATIAHQIERAWVYIAASRGYSYQKVFNNFLSQEEFKTKKRLGIYAHYDKDDIISEKDITTLEMFSKIFSDVIFVTNSDLLQEELDRVTPFVSKIIKRKNIGLDFGAWKHALLAEGKEKVKGYDELILFNNSFFPPVYDMREVFASMEKENVDFWGITLFPYGTDGTYIHKAYIPEHIQSYFTVYRKKVLQSDIFWKFWNDMPEYRNYLDVVSNCETQFTKILSDHGFTYRPYILESYYICQHLNNYAVPYEKPTALVLLRDPLIKKKCYDYMEEEERVKLEYLVKSLQKDGRRNALSIACGVQISTE